MELLDFLRIRIVDILDILLVGILLYTLYKLVRGTIAFTIFTGLLLVFLIWLAVTALEMRLLETILDQFWGAGVLAILIVFQQEIRRYLLMIGRNSMYFNQQLSWNTLMPWRWEFESELKNLNYSEIVSACRSLSRQYTGALIVLAKTSELKNYASSGVEINARVSNKLLETIFNKTSPLHDGAVIIADNEVKAASCILPVSENDEIPRDLGMRHRSALGISEQTDAITIIISEENGAIGIAYQGNFELGVSTRRLTNLLKDHFYDPSLS
jgi:uncharacterized protein (TIGR00159 family)